MEDYSTNYTHDHQYTNFLFKHELGSLDFLTNLMKHSLLVGAEKLLMARNPNQTLSFSDSNPQNDEPKPLKRPKTKWSDKQETFRPTSYDPSPYHDNHHSHHHLINFPQTLISLFTFLMIKTVGFQIRLLFNFLTFPICCLNFSLMLLIFPFQTLSHLKQHLMHNLHKTFNSITFGLVSFVARRIKSQGSVMRLAVRSGKALLRSAYVLAVLFMLLVLGFVMGGVVMKYLVEESIHTTEMLNFDYTKSSPVAVVPVSSTQGPDGVVSRSTYNVGKRAIPYNHKLKVTVSLTLPESEYNRKLGIFQVRVESLSANGNVILGSSYPTMLRFKSQPVRVMETFLNSVPLITGMTSEIQNLNIAMGEFTQGYEPTALFKVVLEQRAEFRSGSGVPEIYGGTIKIASELPPLKRMLSDWRRTAFVWISFAFFEVELMVFLIFCRSVVLPSRGVECKSKKKLCWSDKISW